MAVYRDIADVDSRINGKLTVNGDLTIPSSNVDVGGNVTATKFIGDGSSLTDLPIPVATGTPSSGSTNPISSGWAFTHQNTTGIGSHIPSGGTTGQYLRGDGSWVTPPNTNNYLSSVSGSGNGTITFNRSGLSSLTLNLSHTHSEYLKENDSNKVLGSGFSVKGTTLIGTNGSYGNIAGNLYVRNANGENAIFLTGDNTPKPTTVKSYISSVGDAYFSGNLSTNSLSVTSKNQVANLNAEMVGGVNGKDVGVKQSAYEISSYGVNSGLQIVQDGNGLQTQVFIGAGVAYTSSGKRIENAGLSYSIAAPSTTTNSHRIDTIYIAGPSEGNNEGDIKHKQGAYSSTPVAPSIPSDGITLADIYMGSNQGTITNDKITDRRMWKPVRYESDYLFIEKAAMKENATNLYMNGRMRYKYAASITIPKGLMAKTWTHDFGNSNYTISCMCNSPEPHIYWSSKSANSIVINLDDLCEDDVIIDVVLFEK